MTKQLESNMYPIAKLFSQDFFFRIPEYQRPFMWDREDFFNLVDDLVSASWQEPYFLGTLVLHKQHGSEYDVVDGQQRLTALCILLACVRDALGAINEHKLANELHAKIFQPENTLEGIPAKLRLQVKDQAFFNLLIGAENGTINPLTPLSQGTATGKRYEDARKTFRDKLTSLSKDDLKKFAIFVNKSCTLIYLATDSFEDAFRLFTVVNDRGKQLRRIDVLKAHNLDPRWIPNADARVKYAHQWEDLEAQLGEDRFEDMFHLLRLIYVKDKPATDLHTEFVNRILGKDGLPKSGAAFMDDLKKYVDLYDRLFVDKDYLDQPNAPHVEWRTLLTAMIDHFPANEWKACLLLFADKFGGADLYNFLLRIEKVYLDHWVQGVRKDERYSTYTAILKSIDGATAPAEVMDGIEVDLSKIYEACRAPNFYGAGHAKYLLVRAEIVTSELDHPHHFQVRSIEHVLPQNPKPGGLWTTNFTDAERQELVDSAGNLVLLSKSKNSAAGRREFEEKKVTYLQSRVSDFPRSVQVLSYSSWTPEIIRKRTEDFASIVLQNP
ncbi:DUF262 domain-containing protein [Dactylosporangium sp. CS-047395]|uniref:DUF262 domain-containing protein n=1 Tax=Dactylosporangium sp. CS-047395 TaxID=3239936 RepID=UPI003D92C460